MVFPTVSASPLRSSTVGGRGPPIEVRRAGAGRRASTDRTGSAGVPADWADCMVFAPDLACLNLAGFL